MKSKMGPFSLNVDIKKIQSTTTNSTLLANISFKVNEPGVVWIEGENGTGKTILSSVISGKAFLKKSGLEILGTVNLNSSEGNKLDAKLNTHEYIEHVSFLPQKLASSLLAIHHQDDLCFPLEANFPDLDGVSKKEKNHAASQIIDDLNNKLHLWLHLTKKIGECSYGETKRMEFACILATLTPVVILDEPFSGLDKDWIKVVSESISTIPILRNSIWIITSHHSPEQYNIKPLIRINLTNNNVNRNSFISIGKHISDHFQHNSINSNSEINLNQFELKRKNSKNKIIIKEFWFEPGKINWIEGKNGTGKTTLLLFLSGILTRGLLNKTKVYGNISGGPFKNWVIKAPNDKVRLLLQNPYKSFIYNNLNNEIKDNDYTQENILHEIEKYWGTTFRKSMSFSFGQLKMMQFLLIPKGTELILVDEPLLGVHPTLHQMVIDILQNICESGRTIIATSESNIVDIKRFKKEINYYELPSIN